MYKKEFMEMAVKEAREGIAKRDGGPFGAVVVKDGEMIASGHNRVLANNDSTCHGEIDAIRKAEGLLGTYDLTGCELYTTGEPCPMCLAAIMWANIGKVYYGCRLSDNEGIGFRDAKFNQGGHYFEYRQAKESGDTARTRRELFMSVAVPFLFHGCWDSVLDVISYCLDKEGVAPQVVGGVLIVATVAAGAFYMVRTVRYVRKLAREAE